MFWKKKPKVQEKSVAFQLGELMGKYTDMVIAINKEKDAEIVRLGEQLKSTNKSEDGK